jgi:N utilization substance protein A
MDRAQFIPAIKQICEEKGISEETVFATIEAAMASAFRKDYGEADWKIKADFDAETGETKFWRVFDVVEEVENENNQLTKKDVAKKIKKNKNWKVIKSVEIVKEPEPAEEVKKTEKIKQAAKAKKSKLTKIKKTDKIAVNDQILEALKSPADYGRIAAQTAKQVVIQRIREAERDVIYEEFKKREGEIINGVVQQIEGRNIIIDLGRANGILFPAEQIPNERYYVGQRLKIYIVSVDRTSKAPLINLSRAHEGLIKRLFELEVPEINAGSVEIKGIAREAGRRTKMAVTAHQEGVDPVGSCVGQRGTRVQAVLAEIGEEKIDIIEYQAEPEKYIEAALSPAKVVAVKINKKAKTTKVKVNEDQLSLAIGKEGQNVRLASKLAGFEIDVMKAEEKGKEKKVEESDKDQKTDKGDKEVKEEKIDKLSVAKSADLSRLARAKAEAESAGGVKPAEKPVKKPVKKAAKKEKSAEIEKKSNKEISKKKPAQEKKSK